MSRGLGDVYKRQGISKAGFTGFYAFFLRPDCPGDSALSSTRLHQPSVIVSGLSQAGEVRQPRD